MAQVRQKSAAPQDAPLRASRSSRPEYLSQASGDEVGAASPALGLQNRLGDAFAVQPDADDDRRWSPRTTILLSGGIAFTLWLALAGAVWALLGLL